MGIWSDQLVPRMTDAMLGNAAVRGRRTRTTEGLHGTVLEIGFGSGLNLPMYPDAVERVLAVEPSRVGRELAATRIRESSVPVEFVGLDGQQIPLDDGAADAALSTFTLCTIPDAGRALAEVRRVLRPGGRFHFLEHGLCPDPGVARWQHRCNGIQQRIAGGCNLDRPVDRLVGDAGFEIEDLENEFLEGPKLLHPWGYLYRGARSARRRDRDRVIHAGDHGEWPGDRPEQEVHGGSGSGDGLRGRVDRCGGHPQTPADHVLRRAQLPHGRLSGPELRRGLSG